MHQRCKDKKHVLTLNHFVCLRQETREVGEREGILMETYYEDLFMCILTGILTVGKLLKVWEKRVS